MDKFNAFICEKWGRTRKTQLDFFFFPVGFCAFVSFEMQTKLFDSAHRAGRGGVITWRRKEAVQEQTDRWDAGEMKGCSQTKKPNVYRGSLG